MQQVRDSFSLDKRLIARVRAVSKHQRISRSALYRRAVQEYLARHESGAITAAINECLTGTEQDTEFVEAAQRAQMENGMKGWEWE